MIDGYINKNHNKHKDHKNQRLWRLNYVCTDQEGCNMIVAGFSDLEQ